MNRVIALFIALSPFSADAQNVGPAVGYVQPGTPAHLYAVGIQTSEPGRHLSRLSWVTEWSATASRDGLHGFFASIGPRYTVGGFDLGASGSLLLPIFTNRETEQQTRLYFSPVVAVRNGPAVVSLSFMPQVFPVQKRAYALRVGVAWFVK